MQHLLEGLCYTENPGRAICLPATLRPWGPAMFKKTLPVLGLAAMLASCSVTPERGKAAKGFDFLWAEQGIKATLEYRTVEAPPSKTACAGSLRIENYGHKSYTVLLFNVRVLSASGAVIATDRFSLSSNLAPGGRAEIARDPNNPLNPVNITTRYAECPKDMASVDVKLEAF